MVEDYNSGGAGHPLYQLLDFWIIDGLYLVFIIKILHLGFMIDKNKSFAVEGERTNHSAAILYPYRMRFVLPRMPCIFVASRRVRIGHGLFSRIDEII